MNARSSCLMTVTALLVLAASAPAGAQGLQGRFTIAVEGGTDSPVAGDVLSSASGPLIGLPVAVDNKTYREVYHPGLRLQGYVGYGVSESGEVVVKGSYYKMDSYYARASQDYAAVGTAGDADVFAQFDPYKEWGGEISYRFYLAARTRLKSFVAPVAGLRSIERILMTFTVPAEASQIQNVPLFERSTVAVFGADIGFSFDLGEHFYVGLETGIRYQSKPKQANALPGYESIDDKGDRWSAPVVAVLGARF
jgi:hypothetical protein